MGQPLTRRGVLVGTMAAQVAMVCPAPRAQAADAPRTHHVDIKRFRFVPDRLSVRHGDRIVWINRDIAPHTATALGGAWSTGNLNRDERAGITVTGDMEEEYLCLYHPHMTARIVIER